MWPHHPEHTMLPSLGERKFLGPELSPTSPSLEATFLPSPMSTVLNATTSDITLPSLALPPIDTTMVDFVQELGACPLMRGQASQTRRIFHPSTPSVPLALFHTTHASPNHITAYSMRHTRKIKPQSIM